MTTAPTSTSSFFSCPETCVPTSTKSLGWSVPVAVTVSSRLPRWATAVTRCCRPAVLGKPCLPCVVAAGGEQGARGGKPASGDDRDLAQDSGARCGATARKSVLFGDRGFGIRAHICRTLSARTHRVRMFDHCKTLCAVTHMKAMRGGCRSDFRPSPHDIPIYSDRFDHCSLRRGEGFDSGQQCAARTYSTPRPIEPTLHRELCKLRRLRQRGN